MVSFELVIRSNVRLGHWRTFACPLWVKSRHLRRNKQCLLCPQ